jgi:hypothetical protein
VPVKIYSPEQQSAALDALTETLGSLDKLEQRLLPAYGGTSALIRMERIKEGPVVAEGPSATGIDIEKAAAAKKPKIKHPEDDRAQAAAKARADILKASAAVVERIASFEPLSAQCGLTNETLNTLGVLSDQAAALVEQRYSVDASARQAWFAAGHQNGLQRLTMVHELDCAPVRRALEEALPGFQSVYAKLYSVAVAQPELDPTPAPVAAPVVAVVVNKTPTGATPVVATPVVAAPGPASH